MKKETSYLLVLLLFSILGLGVLGPAPGAVQAASVPQYPSNLTASAVSETAISLIWSDNSYNETGFKIERSFTPDGTYYLLTTVGPNVQTFTDTGLSRDATYWYRIRAYNENGDSYPSNVSGATTSSTSLLAPTGLEATAATGSQINLMWTDRSSNESGFKIERRGGGGGGDFQQIAIVGTNITTYADTGLYPGTIYTYRVRAYNSSRNSDYSNSASAVTGEMAGSGWGGEASVAPAAPSGLCATVTSHSQVILTWNDNSGNETGFKIERALAGGNFGQVGTVNQNTTSYYDSGLQANRTYYYRVRAYNNSGDSDYSTVASVTMTSPAAPSKLEAEILSSSSVKLFWEDNSDSETGFTIERKGEGDFFEQIDTVGANVTSFTDSGVTQDRVYSYRVRAYNSFGSSAYSNEASIITIYLSPPSNLAAETVSSSQIKLSWKDNSTDETGFKLERKTSGGSFAQIAVLGKNVSSYTDTGLNNNIAYIYRVRAYNENANSAYSNESHATTGAVPSAPSDLLAATISNTQVKLTWKDNSGNETGFKLERKTSGGNYAQIARLGVNVTTYTDTGLSANTTYYYRIRAYNSVGNSPYSAEATVSAGVPAAPTKLLATVVSGDKIMLTWVDNSHNETGFKIERKTSGGGYTQIATVGANTTVYANTGISAGTSYNYRVRAYNAVGNSAYSNEAGMVTRAEDKKNIVLNIGKTDYYVNNQRKTMDAAPIISEDRTFLPIRYVAEAIGAVVDWDASLKKTTITLNGKAMELLIGSNSARVDGKVKTIDPDNPNVKPIMVPPGRTMLPLRFVSENLGCKVDWDSASQQITISYP
ncbi:MAG: fibronectin type III domain-containing protein [Dethiobacteria bacterium]|jgi:transcriptional regulator CtsR